VVFEYQALEIPHDRPGNVIGVWQQGSAVWAAACEAA
jgi:hypothetical protein